MRRGRRPRAYYAAGMFEPREQAFHVAVKDLLESAGYEAVLSPGMPALNDYISQGLTLDEAKTQLFTIDVRAVETADLIVVNLDGRVPDEGACVELGIAFGKGKKCIGIRVDDGEPGHLNPILSGVLDYEVAHDLDGLQLILDAQAATVDIRADAMPTIDLREPKESYVVVSGPLGVGKSSLINVLERTGRWTVLPEPVAENPYLDDLYTNMADFAFRNQAFYLGQRARLHNSARDRVGSVVQERCLSEDAEIFFTVNRDRGEIDANDYETLMTLYRSLIVNVPRPDIVIYLTAPFGVTLERIRIRDRIAERDIDHGFLSQLHERYEEWAAVPKPVPVYRIDTTELDFVNRPEDAAVIVRRVDEMLTEVMVSV